MVTRFKNGLVVAVVACAVSIGSGVVASPAEAIHHTQPCTKDNGDYCYDVQGVPGIRHYPWYLVQTVVYNPPIGLNWTCAGATKTDGTFKENSGCAYLSYSHLVTFAAPHIVSQAWGRWRGTGPPTTLFVDAWA
jgi:hypothetical protein